VPLGARRLDVEPDPVVTQDHLDLAALIALLLDSDPDVRGLRVIERVHHTLACVVIQQQGDRRRHVHLVDVRMEPYVGLARHLREEPTDRLSETGAPQWRPVQVSDQCADTFGGAVFGLFDLEQEFFRVINLPGFEMTTRHVHLDREAEQELREVVMKKRRDLHAFVLPFLGHPVGERTENMLAILQLLVRLLESFATEEHLPSKKKW